MAKILGGSHKFNKHVKGYHEAIVALDYDEQVTQEALRFSAAIPEIIKAGLSFKVHHWSRKDGLAFVVTVFEGEDDPSVGAKPWEIALYKVYSNGQPPEYQESKELKDFVQHYNTDGKDEGFATAVQILVRLKIPLLLVRKNPIEDRIFGEIFNSRRKR